MRFLLIVILMFSASSPGRAHAFLDHASPRIHTQHEAAVGLDDIEILAVRNHRMEDAARFLVTVKNRLEEGAFEADLGL